MLKTRSLFIPTRLGASHSSDVAYSFSERCKRSYKLHYRFGVKVSELTPSTNNEVLFILFVFRSVGMWMWAGAYFYSRQVTFRYPFALRTVDHLPIYFLSPAHRNFEPLTDATTLLLSSYASPETITLPRSNLFEHGAPAISTTTTPGLPERHHSSSEVR